MQQALVAVHIVILHLTGGHLIEKFSRAKNLCLFNGFQLQGFHGAFGFCYKENVLYSSLVESNRPARGIVAHRRRNMESTRQLGINANFLCCIQILCKPTFYTLLCRAICKDIILNCFGGMEGFLKVIHALVSREDSVVIAPFDGVVGDMIHNGSGFLFIDKPDNLSDEFFRVILEHRELLRPQPFQDGDNRPPG